MRFQCTQYISHHLFNLNIDITCHERCNDSRHNASIKALNNQIRPAQQDPTFCTTSSLIPPHPPAPTLISHSLTLFGFWKGGYTTRHGSATSKTRQRTSTRKSRFARAAPDAFQPLFLMLKWRATFSGERRSLLAHWWWCFVTGLWFVAWESCCFLVRFWY